MSLLNKKIKLAGVAEPVGTGWLPPVPDLRDYTENQECQMQQRDKRCFINTKFVGKRVGREWVWMATL